MSNHVFVVSEWLPIEGKDDELWQCLKALMALTLEKESGCISARATRQISHPGSPGKSKYTFVLMQEYISVQAFDVHCSTDYVTDFVKTYIDDDAKRIVADGTCRLFSEN